MKLAVVGSRTFSDTPRAFRILDRLAAKYTIDCVVSGGARGADSLGAQWARTHGIPLREYLPDWNRLGRRAGFVRNQSIVEGSDAVLAFWDGTSSGTAHTIRLARERGLPVRIVCF